MYFRKMMEPPEKLIVNGSPIFGTFEGPISKLDIRGIKHPYGGMPLPKTISNFRIKSSLTFMFNIGTHIGNITFFDAKIFGFAEVVFWDKLTGRKYSYKTIMGPRRRFIPHNLEQGFCASFNKKRYIRISWDHARDRISMIFNMAGDSARPSVQAAFTGRFSDSRMCEVTQNTPIFSKRRCSASYFATPQIHGSLTIDKTKITDAQTYTDVEGQGLFFINRSYYAFITEIQFVTGAGIIDGKQVSFIIANTPEEAPDAELVNRNILVVDGICTPLSPVRITHPLGVTNKWIIQDTENMIDLTFEPKSNHFRDMSFLVLHTQMHTIYGNFEGVLKTKDEDTIRLSNFSGVSRNQLLRL